MAAGTLFRKVGNEAPQLLLTTEEARALLRISKWKLYDLIRKNALETIRIGRRRLVPVDAIDKLLDELRREAD